MQLGKAIGLNSAQAMHCKKLVMLFIKSCENHNNDTMMLVTHDNALQKSL